MPILGITGGVATGKTTFTALLRERLPAELFDADACARRLVVEDSAIQASMRRQFGARIFLGEKLDRAALRTLVFGDATARQALEAILHPVIREQWLRLAEKIRREKNWLFVDIPLLFETGAEKFFDAIVVVACSDKIQRRRLNAQRHLTADMASSIIAAQWPLAEKISAAGHVIWNDGTLTALARQTHCFGDYLAQRYG